MTSKLQKFLALSAERKTLLLQSAIRLASTRHRLSRVPFKKLVAHLELVPIQDDQFGGKVPPSSTDSLGTARRIGWAIHTASNQLPWESSCLVQVLAAQLMLQRRGIGGVFYLGANTQGEPAPAGGPESVPGFRAHAWLQCGDVVISGEAGHEAYTIISAYRW